MATRSRIGIVLKDDSILSAYHHWDGYPEWLGVTLKEHYNTDEKVAELIDGGDMSCCWSTIDEDGNDVEPHIEYYGGENDAPELSKSLGELAEIDMGEEYVYLWFMGEWNCYSISRTHDEHWNVTKTNISVVTMPQEEIAS